ncbi:C-C motif chemokine 18-like [Paramisgurnus dabryanus]|uniref:C-C motif chemokine 18-like n=1 Tax=Paramisgurnus dabryanus TaxID=90735 RepID=UPI003CCFD545
MKLHCIFLACLVLFSCCSLANSEYSQGPDKCCFAFSNMKIPLKQVVGYHTTHFQCDRSGIIFIMKSGKKICADLNEKWVQRLKNLVDESTQMMTEGSGDSN